MLDWILATLLAVSVIHNLRMVRWGLYKRLCRKMVAAWQRIGDLEEFIKELQMDRRGLIEKCDDLRGQINQDLQGRKLVERN